MPLRPSALAAVTAITFLIMPVVKAEKHPDWEGWYAELDVALATPGNTNTPAQANGPSDAAQGGSSDLSNSVDWIDWEDDPTVSGTIGYSFGSKGKLQVTFWSYDDSAASSGKSSDYPNYNWFTIGPAASWGYSFYYPMSWGFTQEIQAETIDLEYKRTLIGKERGRVAWGIGARFASFEETVSGSYVIPDFFIPGNQFRFPASRTIDSDGFGFTGSIGGSYDFVKSFGIGSNLRVGFLTSDIDMDHEIVDMDGYYATPGVRHSESVTTEDQVATTFDFQFDLVFHAGRYLDIDAGWFYTTWSELPEFNGSRGVFGTDDQAGLRIVGEERDRIQWSGPRVRFRVYF